MTREAPREVTNVDLGRGLRNLMERIAALTDRQRAMLDQLGEMRREMADIRAMLPEQTYYCPPLALPDGTVVCEGGQQLYRHRPEYERDPDRLYHRLPEDRWFRAHFEGLGEQHVKNHNVWKSEALREPDEDARPQVADEPADDGFPF